MDFGNSTPKIHKFVVLFVLFSPISPFFKKKCQSMFYYFVFTPFFSSHLATSFERLEPPE